MSPASTSTAAVPLSVGLILTLALQTAVPPFATDMYTPAIPRVTEGLDTTAALVGATLTAFFLGLGAGQLIGGSISDQFGRRRPLIIGGLVCMLGGIGCALAPTIWALIAFRVVQGVGGGVAAAVARAVLVDRAKGDQLARVMSIMMAIGGLAPMVAPVAGATVLTLGGGWRVEFWCLTVFGALMMITALLVVKESLPPEARHGGGLAGVVRNVGGVLRIRTFVAYLLTSAFSGLTMMAYIANSSYVLQVMKGLAPLPFSLFFAGTALSQVLLSIVNARLVGRVAKPKTLIGVGLTTSFVAVVLLVITVLVLDVALVPVCIGFWLLMVSQAFVFGNAGALAAGSATHVAGSAAAVQGVTTAVAMAISAPLASSGGGATAVPMIAVMAVGILCALGCYRFLVPRGVTA